MKSIHITFTDGSNPWFMLNASDRDIQNAIRKWKRNFIVVDRFTENDTIYMTLQVKGVDDINEQHVKSKERYLIGRNMGTLGQQQVRAMPCRRLPALEQVQ